MAQSRKGSCGLCVTQREHQHPLASENYMVRKVQLLSLPLRITTDEQNGDKGFAAENSYAYKFPSMESCRAKWHFLDAR